MRNLIHWPGIPSFDLPQRPFSIPAQPSRVNAGRGSSGRTRSWSTHALRSAVPLCGAIACHVRLLLTLGVTSSGRAEAAILPNTWIGLSVRCDLGVGALGFPTTSMPEQLTFAGCSIGSDRGLSRAHKVVPKRCKECQATCRPLDDETWTCAAWPASSVAEIGSERAPLSHQACR